MVVVDPTVERRRAASRVGGPHVNGWLSRNFRGQIRARVYNAVFIVGAVQIVAVGRWTLSRFDFRIHGRTQLQAGHDRVGWTVVDGAGVVVARARSGRHVRRVAIVGCWQGEREELAVGKVNVARDVVAADKVIGRGPAAEVAVVIDQQHARAADAGDCDFDFPNRAAFLHLPDAVHPSVGASRCGERRRAVVIAPHQVRLIGRERISNADREQRVGVDALRDRLHKHFVIVAADTGDVVVIGAVGGRVPDHVGGRIQVVDGGSSAERDAVLDGQIAFDPVAFIVGDFTTIHEQFGDVTVEEVGRL